MIEMFVIIFVVPILPSIILTLMAVWAFRRNRRFLYYNSSFASVCNVIFLILFLLWFFYAPRRLDAQEGLVLLGLPILGLIFSVGGFLLGLLGYDFTDKSEDENPLPTYPFWASVAAICGFALFWLVPVFIRPFYFVYEK
jgi:hypothetical protein